MYVLRIIVGIALASTAGFARILQVKQVDESWHRSFGMSQQVFNETIACIKQLRQQLAKGRENEQNEQDTPLRGDSLMSLQDCQAALVTVSLREKRSMDDWEINPIRKWDMPIPIATDGTPTETDMDTIVAALEHWEQQTCVEFRNYDPLTDLANQVVVFSATLEGCSTYGGKRDVTEIYPQPVYLESGACTDILYHAVHQLGLVLGMRPIHNRPDRDDWISTYEENIDPDFLDQFVPDSDVNLYGIPYDYGSIMQYSKTRYQSSCGLVTMEAKELYSEYTMGQLGTLSFFDAKIINMAYCPDACANAAVQLNCKNGGYMDPNDCSTCRCPEGLGGKLCDRPTDAEKACEPHIQDVWAADDLRYVSSPGHGGGEYTKGDSCSWFIHSSPLRSMELWFDPVFDVYCLEDPCEGPTCLHYVEVKYKQDKSQRGARFCCYDDSAPYWNNPGIITPEDTEVLVTFASDFPVLGFDPLMPPASKRTGFKLYYQYTPCKDGEFTCGGELSQCIPEIQVCDGTQDCPDGDDEEKNMCKQCAPWVNFGNCSHHCGGCGRQFMRRDCLHILQGAGTPFFEVTYESCNVHPCNMNDPNEALMWQKFSSTYMDGDKEETMVFWMQVHTLCCFDFCASPMESVPIPNACINGLQEPFCDQEEGEGGTEGGAQQDEEQTRD